MLSTVQVYHGDKFVPELKVHGPPPRNSSSPLRIADLLLQELPGELDERAPVLENSLITAVQEIVLSCLWSDANDLI